MLILFWYACYKIQSNKKFILKTRPFLVYFKRINKLFDLSNLFDSKLVIAVKISKTRGLSFVQSIYNETCSTQIICLGFISNNYLPFSLFWLDESICEKVHTTDIISFIAHACFPSTNKKVARTVGRGDRWWRHN